MSNENHPHSKENVNLEDDTVRPKNSGDVQKEKKIQSKKKEKSLNGDVLNNIETTRQNLDLNLKSLSQASTLPDSNILELNHVICDNSPSKLTNAIEADVSNNVILEPLGDAVDSMNFTDSSSILKPVQSEHVQAFYNNHSGVSNGSLSGSRRGLLKRGPNTPSQENILGDTDSSLAKPFKIPMKTTASPKQEDREETEMSFSIKRKRSSSSLRKRRSGTLTPSSNDSQSQTSLVSAADTCKDTKNKEPNETDSSEDELVVRRSKRKCFSLDGSPLSVKSSNSSIQNSQNNYVLDNKSFSPLPCIAKTNEKIPLASDVVALECSAEKIVNCDTNDTMKSDITTTQNNRKVPLKRRSLFTKKTSTDQICNDFSTKLEHHNGWSNVQPQTKNLQDSCDNFIQSDVNEIRISQKLCSQSGSSQNNSQQKLQILSQKSCQDVFKNSQSETKHQNLVAAGEIDLLDAGSHQDLTAIDNAETLPPSGLPTDCVPLESSDSEESALNLPDHLERKDDFSEDDVIKDTFERDEVRESVADDHEEELYADLPYTSSPIMATGRSVKSLVVVSEDEEETARAEDDDDAEDVVIKKSKRKRSAIIESDDDISDADESSTHLNSSSAFSSQSEVTTQQRGAMANDIVKMRQQIKELEVELGMKINQNDNNQEEVDDDHDGDHDDRNGDHDDQNEEEDDYIGHQNNKERKRQRVATVIRSSPEIENSDSDSDLFLSPLQFSPPPINLEDVGIVNISPEQKKTNDKDELDNYENSDSENQQLLSENVLGQCPKSKIQSNSNIDCLDPLSDPEIPDLPNAGKVESLEVNDTDFNTCAESPLNEEPEDQVDSDEEDKPEEIPEEVRKAMEILQKYKSNLLNSQVSPASSKHKLTPTNSRKGQSKNSSPLITSTGNSAPGRISLEAIEDRLKDITPSRLRSKTVASKPSNKSGNVSNETTPNRKTVNDIENKLSYNKQSKVSVVNNCAGKSSPIRQEHREETTTLTPTAKTPSNSRQTGRFVPRAVLSPVKATNTRSNSMSQSVRCNFAATGLRRDQALKLQKLASLSDAKFYCKFNKSVTHLIVKTESREIMACDRTLKFFQGVAQKCWILNYSWVEDSFKAGYMLQEDSYEIIGDTVTGESHHGPQRSRLSEDLLFSDIAVTCCGISAEMSKVDMISLLETCGARYTINTDKLATIRGKRVIICCSDTVDRQPTTTEAQFYISNYSNHGLVSVAREWVLDCISTYKLLPLKDYLLTPRPVKLPF